MWRSAYVHLEVREREGVEAQELVGQEVANACEVFDSLDGLYGADVTCHGSEDTDLCCRLVCAGRGLVAVEASKTGVVRGMGEGLTFVAEDAAMGEWLAREDTSVVDEVFGIHIVGRVDDKIIARDDVEGVSYGQRLLVGTDVDGRVESLELPSALCTLGRPRSSVRWRIWRWRLERSTTS